MANECLVTKLKSVVENNTLSKIGEAKMILTHPANNIVHLGIDYYNIQQTPIVRAVGASVSSGSYYPNLGSFDINPSSANPFPIFIKDKYNIKKLFLENSLCTIDYNDIYQMNLTNCSILNIQNTKKISLSKIVETNPSLVSLYLSRQDRLIESSDSIVLSDTHITSLLLLCNVTWNHKENPQSVLLIRGVDFGDSLDNFLIDMAALVNEGRMGTGGTCGIKGTLTGSADELAAIATLKSAYTTQFVINSNPM